MKKISLLLLMLFVFISCGKTSPSSKYLQVVSTTPESSKKDVFIADSIIINFNQEIETVNMALINTDEISGKVAGTSTIVGKQFTFKPEYDLKYTKYQVSIYKTGTISSSKQMLKENYSYTFTTVPHKINETPDVSKPKEEEENKTTTDTTKPNQSYSTCDLVPQGQCDDVKPINQN